MNGFHRNQDDLEEISEKTRAEMKDVLNRLERMPLEHRGSVGRLGYLKANIQYPFIMIVSNGILPNALDALKEVGLIYEDGEDGGYSISPQVQKYALLLDRTWGVSLTTPDSDSITIIYNPRRVLERLLI